MRDALLAHKEAIVLALLTALIIAGPQLYFRAEHRASDLYQGIELIPDSPWSPRVREVMDGHPSLGSIYYQDGKGDPYLFQPFGTIAVASLGMLFGLDINNTLLLQRLLLTFAAVLLIYGFVYLVWRDKLVALAGAAAVPLAESIFNPTGLMNFLQGTAPASFLGLAAPVNHAMIFIPLFGFLITFWLFYTTRQWRWGIVSMLLLGLNFYNYFYSWTYLYAFGGVLVLVYLFQKNWSEAVRIGSVFAGALLVAIPYGLNLYHASLYPSYDEVAMRFGVIASHAPLFIGVVPLAVLLAFLLWYPREDRRRYLFGLALLLAPIVTMNQQLITGKVMQAAHYHWYFHKPIAVIFTISILFYLFGRERWQRYRNILAAAIIAVSIAAGAFTQAASYLGDATYGENAAVERQRFGPALAWLNQQVAPESVVLANNEISHLVTIYTPLNVFYHRAGYASLAATYERLLDQLFTFYRLRGIDVGEARDVFFTERKEISWNIYGLYYRQVLGSYEAIPDEKVEEILAAYQKTLVVPTPAWLTQKLAQYEVAYVIWDKKKDPSWQLERYPFLEEAAVFGDVAIYRFIP